MKYITTLFLFLLTSLYSTATIFTVNVTNNQFSPADLPNVVVGDVIEFHFLPGNFHNVTTTPLGLVPVGAAPIYSGDVGSVTTTYSYTVTTVGNYRYYCEAHSSDGITGMVGTFTVSGIVPVILKNFEVAYSNRAVSVTWQTATELNMSHFLLQKSTDGKTYTEVGRISAVGNAATLQSYSFMDERLDMNSRYIYYMLKAVNNDGSYSLSPVKLVRNELAVKKLIIQMGPNPVKREVGHLMFQFYADKDAEMQTQVLDINGKKIMNLELSANKGINSGHIHMGDLPAGTYNIIFSLDGSQETRKVIVE